MRLLLQGARACAVQAYEQTTARLQVCLGSRCRCFLADGTGRRLVSGGNDRRVLLWDWAAAAPPGSGWAAEADAGSGPGSLHAGGAGALLHAIEHGAKVNCVEAGANGAGRAVVLVGGTQRRLAVYEVH